MKTLEKLREGVAATKWMLLERCEMREDDDGPFRSDSIILRDYTANLRFNTTPQARRDRGGPAHSCDREDAGTASHNLWAARDPA